VKRKRTKTTSPPIPPAPFAEAPAVWFSVDPGGTKESWAVEWHGAEAVRFLKIETSRPGWALAIGKAPHLVVIEEGLPVVKNPHASLPLEATRGRLEGWADAYGADWLRVKPDGWRLQLGLPRRKRKGETDAQFKAHSRTLCDRLYAHPLMSGSQVPHIPLAAEASNDDKREALLLGLACALHWRWL